MPLAGLVGIHHSPAPGPSGTLPELLNRTFLQLPHAQEGGGLQRQQERWPPRL